MCISRKGRELAWQHRWRGRDLIGDGEFHELEFGAERESGASHSSHAGHASHHPAHAGHASHHPAATAGHHVALHRIEGETPERDFITGAQLAGIEQDIKALAR